MHVKTSFLVVGALFLTVTVSVPSEVLSQQYKARRSDDDIFRRIGISKTGEGTRAPDFNLKGVTGSSTGLGHFRGSVIFLNFWATWCGPCRSEMQSMERLYTQLRGQGLVMLAVDEKEGRDRAARFMRDFGLSFPALLDLDGRVASLYGVWAIPTTYLIDATGKKIGMKAGPKDWASPDVLEFFRNLVEKNEKSGSVSGSIVLGPVEPLPRALLVKSKAGSVHVQQDPQSELVAKVERGEELSPLGKAFGGGEGWYMVRTKTGAIGWIKESDLEEASKAK